VSRIELYASRKNAISDQFDRIYQFVSFLLKIVVSGARTKRI